eukprot:gnl/Dysnectes_brevis/3528_a4481_859.p1 GENE.gnl/Dysnectes_brevis/3528_a4481_859~~gnl/Dysnectes_brevis/3528_a4481_859.p1  ORF type:complete len:448 (-),score=65.01 gnl/Dysnectes_brevis/3528_a4481_859:31-1374(-)
MDKLTSEFVKKHSVPSESQLDLEKLSQITCDLCGLETATHFPGSQPVSLESRTGLTKIVTERYVACEKTDGTRFLLLVPKQVPQKGKPIIAYLIGRRFEFIQFNLQFRDKKAMKFKVWPSLFDGELVTDTITRPGTTQSKTFLSFYIFDAMNFAGRDLSKLNLVERLKRVKPFLNLVRSPDVKMVPKRMYPKSKLAHLFSTVLPSLPHENDGIIFTPVDPPYKPGTCPGIMKWKPREKNSVDFKVKVTIERGVVIRGEEPVPTAAQISKLPLRPVVTGLLQVASGGAIVSEPIASVDIPHKMAMKLAAKPSIMDATAFIFEAVYRPDYQTTVYTRMCTDTARVVFRATTQAGGWELKKQRKDKRLPNDFKTYMSVQKSIDDHVSEDRLIRIVEGAEMPPGGGSLLHPSPFGIREIINVGYDGVKMAKITRSKRSDVKVEGGVDMKME